MKAVTELSLTDTIAVLSRTPAALNGLLRGLPDTWVQSNEGEGTFTPYDVVGHLIAGDRHDWIPRARRILEHGESVPFDPVDRLAQKRESAGKTLEQLLDEFAVSRRQALEQLHALHLRPEDFDRRGTHPVFGAVTLGQLLATWMVHDMTHLHQISRTIASQYREAVGPWSAYLGVLRCSGHSD